MTRNQDPQLKTDPLSETTQSTTHRKRRLGTQVVAAATAAFAAATFVAGCGSKSSQSGRVNPGASAPVTPGQQSDGSPAGICDASSAIAKAFGVSTAQVKANCAPGAMTEWALGNVTNPGMDILVQSETKTDPLSYYEQSPDDVIATFSVGGHPGVVYDSPDSDTTGSIGIVDAGDHEVLVQFGNTATPPNFAKGVQLVMREVAPYYFTVQP